MTSPLASVPGMLNDREPLLVQHQSAAKSYLCAVESDYLGLMHFSGTPEISYLKSVQKMYFLYKENLYKLDKTYNLDRGFEEQLSQLFYS